ncbi:MAG TPA: thymidylate kinase, partial [Paracoccaceae bacterium]|nr:thymidylate kinase [Paracoccaceae bacterium]
RGDLRATVDQLHTLMIGREPDLTVLIDIDPGVGLGRALSRGGTEERFESFGEGMQAQMRAGFLALAQEFANRFVVINGARDMDAVAEDVARIVGAQLP